MLVMSEIKSLEGLTRTVMSACADLVGADRCAVFVVEKEGGCASGNLVAVHASGDDGQHVSMSPISRDKGVVGHVVRTGEVINTRDAYSCPHFDSSTDGETGWRTRALLCLPLRSVHGDNLGAIEMLNKKGDPSGYFTAEDEELMNTVSGIVSVALQNHHLYAEARRERRRSQALVEAISASVEKGDVFDIIARVVAATTKVLGADRAAVFLVNSIKGTLYCVFGRTVEGSSMKMGGTEGKKSLAGACAESGQTIRLDDAYDDARFNKDNDERTGYRTRSMLCAPIHDHNGKVIAVIQALNKIVVDEHRIDEKRDGYGKFDEEDVKLVELMASKLTAVVQHTVLEAYWEERSAHLNESFLSESEAHDNIDVANFLSMYRRKSHGSIVGMSAPAAAAAAAAADSLGGAGGAGGSSSSSLSSSSNGGGRGRGRGRSRVPSADSSRQLTASIPKEELALLYTWSFNVFKYQVAELDILAVALFERLGVVKHFSLDGNKLATLISRIREEYKDPKEVQYHNFYHGFSVFHGVAVMMDMSDVVPRYLTMLDVLILLVAAIGHDTGHNGLSNQFHVKSRGRLALLYNDTSPLENMHASILMTLMK